MLRHRTMVAGLVPSRTCGTRGSWRSSVMNVRGPRRGVRVALSFLVEGQQRHIHCLDDLLLNPRDSKNPFVTAKSQQNQLSESAQGFMDLPQRGGAFVNTPCCPPLIGQGPTAYLSGAGFQPCLEKADPPLHACPRKVVVVKLPRTSSGIRLRQRCSVARELRAASAMVPWIVMGRGVMQMGWLLDGLLDVRTKRIRNAHL